MAIVKTITENNGSYKATWTLTIPTVSVTATSSTVDIPFPSSFSAKYVYSGKTKGGVSAYAKLVGFADMHYAHYEKGGLGESYSSDSAMVSGTTYTIPRASYDTGVSSHTIQTSALFTSTNKESRTKQINIQFGTGILESGVQTSLGGDLTYYGSYSFPNNTWAGNYENGLDMGAYATVTLDAPPQVTIGTPTYPTPYAGLGAYTVPLTTLTAQYGGDITSVTLTVGADSTTQTYSASTVSNQTISVTPSVAGTYTPTITVTDSRGQVTTAQLPQITVNAYNAPSINFDVERCTNISGHIGVPDVEGEEALVTANISYTKAIANLTQPTVLVQDSDGNTVASSATWYETWTAQDGVDDAVNWTNYNPSNPVTLYAVVSATSATLSQSESYSISITPADNRGGNAQTITQTLPTSFFTIDFQAGGKEIAFGAPANDTLTIDQQQSGLFKCAMEMITENKVSVGKDLSLALSEYQDTGTTDKALYDAITTLNWGSETMAGDLLEVKELLTKILSSVSSINSSLTTINNKLSVIGTVYYAYTNTAISSTSIDTVTLGAHVSLPAGTYVAIGHWQFNTRSSSGTTNSQIALKLASATSNQANVRVFASGNNWNALSTSNVITLGSSDTLYVAGSTSRAYTTATFNDIMAIRIK